MRIETRNDGKEKRYSWEAVLGGYEFIGGGQHYSYDFTAYGGTETEAVERLLNCLLVFKAQLDIMIRQTRVRS